MLKKRPTASQSFSQLIRQSSTKGRSELYLNLLSEKRVLLKFGLNRLYLQETDAPPFEHEYRHVLYLNNSITHENFFCLAYSDKKQPGADANLVHGLILYSEDVELIDDVIREYAVNVSSELNVQVEQANQNHHHHQPPSSKQQQQQPNVKFELTTDSNQRSQSPKFQTHTCMLCPMQQFVELCEFLKV